MANFNPSENMNLYRQPNEVGSQPAFDSFEEGLAAAHGGTPAEWIPDAERQRTRFASALAARKEVAAIYPKPQSDGIFQGFHQMIIFEIHPNDKDEPIIAERVIYLTPKQYETKQFQVPVEGIFALNSEECVIEEIS